MPFLERSFTEDARTLTEEKGRSLTALITASETLCSAEIVVEAAAFDRLFLKSRLAFPESPVLISLSTRYRTVVQQCLRGNDLKPLEEQELMSSERKSFNISGLGKGFRRVGSERVTEAMGMRILSWRENELEEEKGKTLSKGGYRNCRDRDAEWLGKAGRWYEEGNREHLKRNGGWMWKSKNKNLHKFTFWKSSEARQAFERLKGRELKWRRKREAASQVKISRREGAEAMKNPTRKWICREVKAWMLLHMVFKLLFWISTYIILILRLWSSRSQAYHSNMFLDKSWTWNWPLVDLHSQTEKIKIKK